MYEALDRPLFRPVLAALATMQASWRLRKLCRVTYENAWIHEFPDGVLVEPRPRLRGLPEIERTVKDMWMYEYLPRVGDIVFDIGAGTGWETLFFSRSVGGSGRVISVEAHPRTFACLTETCRRNRLQNVTPINRAVMNNEGEVLISDDADFANNNVFWMKSGIPVPCVTLDGLFASSQLPRIDLLKMNIEGAERLALAGMTKAIRYTRRVSVACHDFVADQGGSQEMRSKAAVTAFLEENGFEISLRSSDPRPWIRDCVYGRNAHCRCPEPDAELVGQAIVSPR